MYPQPILEIQSFSFLGLKSGFPRTLILIVQRQALISGSVLSCHVQGPPRFLDICGIVSFTAITKLYVYPAWTQIIPLTQFGQRRWARLIWPPPGHLLRLFTSLRALPAICRWRFFMWEVFFLGTARRTESQRSDRRDGILREIEIGCKNPLVAMGVIGRNRASRGN